MSTRMQPNPGFVERLPDAGAAPASGLRVRVQHAYPGFALDVDLQLPGRGVTALFGHSGSGKTTLLRCVAGLECAAQARIDINGVCWQDANRFLPTWQRSIGYVFQEASLFPHLDVRGNLAFGMKRATGAVREDEIRTMAARFGIEHLLARKPNGLSGGERQRVAIARALLTQPRLLLMDEPLSALDSARKREILPYLDRLHDELEIPVLYVTHQIEEAMRLADHLVLLESGQVLASGPLGAMLTRLDLPLAREQEAGVVIEAQVIEHDAHWHLNRMRFAGGDLYVGGRALEAGRSMRVRIVASDVSVALSGDDASSIQNRFACKITVIAPADDPAQCLVGLEADGVPLMARITRRSAEGLGLAVDKQVWAQVKAVALLD